MRRPPYAPTCTALGLVLGWLPALLHGPIAAKFTLLSIDGPVAVLGFHAARLLIGAAVGLVVWPRPWWLRGPLCGAALMLPVGLVVLAMPGCGAPCFARNLATGALVGTAVGGLARLLTGRGHPA